MLAVVVESTHRYRSSGHDRDVFDDRTTGRPDDRTTGRSDPTTGRTDDRTTGRSDPTTGRPDDRTTGRSDPTTRRPDDRTTGRGGRSAATNTCRVCAPLGAVLAFRGLRGCVPLVHGSQGCATYIRRYLISHFREPMDVASTSFTESSTVFGGRSNLREAVANLASQYRPEVIGVCTTCLAETIGEDTRGMLRDLAGDPALPRTLFAATPSFKGCQHRGFHDAVAAILAQTAQGGERLRQINLLAGPVSPADLRHLREVVDLLGLPTILFPDYSETLDGPSLARYEPIPAGGTGLDQLARAGRSQATIQLGAVLDPGPGQVLDERHGVPLCRYGLPIGVTATDAVFGALGQAAGASLPAAITAERGRLIDAYVDGHKYLAGRRVAVVGDPDLVAALAGFAAEIGLRPVLAASGAATGRLAAALAGVGAGSAEVLEDADHDSIAARLTALKPDLILGPSKCYPAARALGIPLVRVGFPVHDRLGAGRILHFGYRGTQRLFDEIVNTLLAQGQNASEIGYAYL
jgi:nitrogenase molybdenum-iron protein NifN